MKKIFPVVIAALVGGCGGETPAPATELSKRDMIAIETAQRLGRGCMLNRVDYESCTEFCRAEFSMFKRADEPRDPIAINKREACLEGVHDEQRKRSLAAAE